MFPRCVIRLTFPLVRQDFNLKSTLSEYQCGPKCPYYQGLHPIGARSNGLHYNAAAIPKALAEEVAEHVHATMYQQRIRKTPAVELTDLEIAEFNDAMTNVGKSTSAVGGKKKPPRVVPVPDENDDDDDDDGDKKMAAADDDDDEVVVVDDQPAGADECSDSV